MPEPAVTVLVTTFQAESYVADALDGVLAQTFRDYEVLVVDDASADGTCERVEMRLRGRCDYRIERLPINAGGPARPRNVGSGLARGRWVALLDSDDIWHPQKLEIELQVAAACRASFVSSEKRWFRDPGETRVRAAENLRSSGPRLRQVTHAQLRRKNFLCTSSVMAERELFCRHPFPEDPAYRAVEDYRCWLDIHRESIASHPQILIPLVFYRVSGSSISASKAAMVRKHWRLYGDYFRGRPWATAQVLASMTTYCFASLYRQFKYRGSRC